MAIAIHICFSKNGSVLRLLLLKVNVSLTNDVVSF